MRWRPGEENIHLGPAQAEVPGRDLPGRELRLQGGERRLPLAGQDHLQAQRAAQKGQLQHRVALIRRGPELACTDVWRAYRLYNLITADYSIWKRR